MTTEWRKFVNIPNWCFCKKSISFLWIFSSECYVFNCYDNKIGQKTPKANFQHMLLGQSLKNQCNSSFIFFIHIIAHLSIIITMLLHICIVRLLILCCIRSMQIMNPVKYMYIEVRYTTYFHIGYNYLAYLEALGNRIFTWVSYIYTKRLRSSFSFFFYIASYQILNVFQRVICNDADLPLHINLTKRNLVSKVKPTVLYKVRLHRKSFCSYYCSFNEYIK